MLVVKNVRKELNSGETRKLVLNNVSFHIAENEFVSIIGKNGAGKTTLLNILSGIWKADEGFVRIMGCKDTLKDFDVLRKISYVSGTKSQLWSDMNLRFSFENCAKMYRMSKEKYKLKLDELIDLLEIGECMDVTVQNLSLGQRMRAEFVYALLPEPEILFLDEAMIGLDITIKERLLNYLANLKKDKKTTLIYTSHNLLEVERICDRVILLDEGKVIYDDSINKIMTEFSPTYKMVVYTNNELPDMEDLPLERYEINNNKCVIWFDKQKVDKRDIIRHITEQCEIVDMRLDEPTLEDTIKNIYRKELLRKEDING